MKRYFKFLFVIVIALIFAKIFYPWFLHKEIIGGDWPYFYPENILSFSPFPPIWSSTHGNGLGGQIISYALDSYLYLSAWFFTSFLHLPWAIIYRICWYGLFLVLSVWTSFFLYKKIFPTSHFGVGVLSSLIFTTNTYILMVVGGGQMGVALAYSLSPLVLVLFFPLVENDQFVKSIKHVILFGLIFGLEVLLDIRIAYLLVIAIGLLLLIFIKQLFHQQFFKIFILRCIIAAVIATGINAFWIIPVLFIHENPFATLGAAYTSAAAVKFFSFAKFEDALSFIHPNWPENIFGLTHFLRPEFLLLPLLAFSSLLFIGRQKAKEGKQRDICFVYFSLLALVGIFLAKGANDPFGGVYLWLFHHVPGFVMFRDPVKFYVLISLSYAILIPFSVEAYGNHIAQFFKRNLFKQLSLTLFSISFLVMWIVLIFPAVSGKLGGTFVNHSVPQEYLAFKNVLISQPQFFRTLWIPRQSRFAYASAIHPAVEGEPLFNVSNPNDTVRELEKSGTEQRLEDMSIKYVVVPYDSLGEIFVADRKYDAKTHDSILAQLHTISWLQRVPSFGRLAVFVLPTHKDHFWLDSGENVSYSMRGDTSYTVSFSITSPTMLHFSEAYSKFWIATEGQVTIIPSRGQNGLQEYRLSKKGKYTLHIFVSYQPFFLIGKVISIIATVCVVIYLLYVTIRKYEK